MNIQELITRVEEARNKKQAANDRITEARSVEVKLDYTRSNEIVDYMTDEMVTNARDIQARRSLGGYLSILHYFYEQVKERGPWDHKYILEDRYNFGQENDGSQLTPSQLNSLPEGHRELYERELAADRFSTPIEGDTEHEYFYDIWSNIHYGYVGRAGGIPEPLLVEAAEQAGGGYNPSDELSIRIGMEMWEEHGENITPDDLRQAVLDHTDDYLKIQEEDARNNDQYGAQGAYDGNDVDVVRQPWNGY